jgi:glycosyltransferase involved in cell wall biosynthesis
MRIAFVSQALDSVLPPKQNSVGIWTYQTALRLAPRHEVLVVSRGGKGLPTRSERDGIRFDFVPVLPGRLWDAAGRARRALLRGTQFFARPYYRAEYVAQCIRRLRAFNPDVIHIHNFVNHIPAFRRSFPDAVLVIHMHCDWLVELDREETARSLGAADIVVGCSDHVAQSARRRFPELDLRFANLPNGVGPAPVRASGPGANETVITVGRVSPEKGLHVLLEAWAQVHAARPRAELQIVGPVAVCPRDLLVDLSTDPDVQALSRFYPEKGRPHRPYGEALRAMIPEALAATVRFVGPEPHERVLLRFQEAAVLVSPSLSEAFGMSLIEALAAGTPVVASRVGGMTEVVEKTGGGLLVEKADPGVLAEAIIRLLEDTGLRERLGAEGRGRVPGLYGWDSVAATAETLYAEAAAGRRVKG